MEGFRIIGITLPGEWESAAKEAEAIALYLNNNAVDLFHIRKPVADINYTQDLILKIPPEYHKKLILHSHYSLFPLFEFGGVHIKINEDKIASLESKIISRSCHSLDECLQDAGNYTYSFLSPIFDSISKTGYLSSFSLEDPGLVSVTSSHPIIALGGVIPAFFSKLFDAKFAGAALLGYLWSPKVPYHRKIQALLNNKHLIANKNI